MNIPFLKMHGAGNDFILVDDRDLSFPMNDSAWMAAVSARKTGAGCDGIILIQPSNKADFRMRFVNPDGREVEMCGNGARCAARLAHEIGAAPAEMTIETAAGTLRARAQGTDVLLYMTPPADFRLKESIEVDGRTVTFSFVNTGVPHAIVEVEDLDAFDVEGTGRAVRRHEHFSPEGTNADFITVAGPNSLRLRTYERGVEAETLACGTGVAASALIAAKLALVEAPVQVSVASGDTLTVNFALTEAGAEDVTLLGPTAHVYKGTLEYGE
ncbi:MAG: diaminopimelate epimerase [Kiritimatiellia bacterium]